MSNIPLNGRPKFPIQNDDSGLLSWDSVTRFVQHLNWKRTLNDSDLPEDIQALIKSVVKQTRLLAFEKSSVASELVNHFHDGNTQGVSYSKLVAEFGDPETTATLIRRSKIRSRPMFIKLLKSFGIGIATLAAFYVAMSVYFHMGKPNPTIDYLADLNLDYSVIDDSEKAWPTIYRDLWTKYRFCEGGDSFKEIYAHHIDEEGNDRYSRLVRPGDDEWEGAIAKLESIEELLTGFREGAKLPYLGVELQADPRKYSAEDFAALFPGHTDQASYENGLGVDGMVSETDDLFADSMLGVLLPHIQRMRSATRIFIVDTRWAIEQNDSERVVENFETIFGLSRQAADYPFLVCSLVGVACSNIAFDMIEEVITEHPDFLSDEQLARIQSAVEAIDFNAMLKVKGEDSMIHDMIQRCYTDDGNGDGRFTSVGFDVMPLISGLSGSSITDGMENFVEVAITIAEPASLLLVASRKETTEKANEILEVYDGSSKLPYWNQSAEYQEVEEFLQANEKKYLLLSMLMPAFEQIYNAKERSIGQQDGVALALAMIRYQRRNGSWATQYEQLAPEFISEIPFDRMDGSLLKFTSDENGFVIYSIGNDRDDDGGKYIYDTEYHAGQDVQRSHVFSSIHPNTEDGDWVLWPTRRWMDEPEEAQNVTDSHVVD